jgi:hypothetical protein
MRKLSIIFGIISLCFLGSCYDDDFYYRPGGKGGQGKGSISIYILKDGQVDRSSVNIDLNRLEVEKPAWISDDEIYFYDWSAHIFYLTAEKGKAKYSGRYFLVKEDDTPLFVGFFFPPQMSSFSLYPSIIAMDGTFFPGDVAAIGGFGGYNSQQMNDNVTFKNALIRAGLLRYGISAELTNLQKKNSTTVEYTFRVTNTDNDFIYVLDPDKMGAAKFHYYTNGVSFVKGTTYYFSDNPGYTASSKILSDWYYRLAPGKSITRTVELGGFKTLPPGTFTCNFSFPGSSLKAGEWKMQDGYIWLGDFYVKKDFSF